MNLRQLEAFRQVVSTGTTVAAGRALNLSQPSISKLIKDFQGMVGVPLFRRENGRLIPTIEGLALFGEVDKAFASIDAIAQFVNRIRTIRTGHVEIVIAACVAHSPITRAVAKIAPMFPGYSFGLGSDDAAGALDQLQQEKIDLAVIQIPANPDGIEIIPLVEARCVCVLPPGHPLAARRVVDVADLAGEPLVLIHPRYRWRRKLDDSFRRAGIQPLIRAEAMTSAHACSLASHGLGVALVDELTTREVNVHAALIRPFSPAVWQSIGIAIVRRQPRTGILMTLIEAFQLSVMDYTGWADR